MTFSKGGTLLSSHYQLCNKQRMDTVTVMEDMDKQGMDMGMITVTDMVIQLLDCRKVKFSGF